MVICNIPVYKLAGLPLLFQYPRVWLLIILFILLIISLKPRFELKYFIISLVIFALPSLAFYKYSNDGAIEIRPKAGVLYNFTVSKNQIELYTCLGNRDSIEIINFASEKIDSTNFTVNNPQFANSKAVFVNNEKLIFMSDENNGVGMYYLKVKAPRVVK